MDIQHLHRTLRPGFKAGALAAAARAGIRAISSPFSTPVRAATGFLLRTVPALAANVKAGYLQTRWAHLNETTPCGARQALALDGHSWSNRRCGRAAAGSLGFNGTAGLWRRTCIEDAGGWQADTL